jgi:hypothetical protein
MGAGLSAGIMPESLKSMYVGRVNFGFGVFVTLRRADVSLK